MNSLQDNKITGTLKRLHKEARGDGTRWDRDPTTNSNDLIRMGSIYLSISEQEGTLLYLLARSCRARCIVEFGASYGVSSIYLAAAARDNDGTLTTTEVHPQKCAALQDSFAQAGLADRITLLEGDARETLTGVQGPVDFLFLDGWKSMYLPVFEILKPVLAPGVMIVADNITHPAARNYLAAIRAPDSGFVSATVDKQEISIKVESEK